VKSDDWDAWDATMCNQCVCKRHGVSVGAPRPYGSRPACECQAKFWAVPSDSRDLGTPV
jgi:hypothetical protein